MSTVGRGSITTRKIYIVITLFYCNKIKPITTYLSTLYSAKARLLVWQVRLSHNVPWESTRVITRTILFVANKSRQAGFKLRPKGHIGVSFIIY